jgi:RimJ/RimL family protein N-acetyltransferase
MNIIESTRLTFRKMTEDDLHALKDIVCDEQTMYAFNGAWSEEEAVAGLQKQINSYRENGFGRWAVILKETGRLIGICGLMWDHTDKSRVLEIGYFFNRSFWNNGYATEAAIACKKYAFEVLGYDEVFSLTRDTNFAAMNVAIRNGMFVRGMFFKHYKGEDISHYIFSVRR